VAAGIVRAAALAGGIAGGRVDRRHLEVAGCSKGVWGKALDCDCEEHIRKVQARASCKDCMHVVVVVEVLLLVEGRGMGKSP